MSAPTNVSELRPSVVLDGKNILLSGTTGFLGKVVLAMLLRRYPNVGKVFALIRPGTSERAKDRFNHSVATSPALRPLVEQYGDGVGDFLEGKVVPIDGDIIEADCGISPTDLEALQQARIDVVINSAGLVDFDPPIDQALGINALGIQNVVQLARRLDAALVHVSTCFVAGRRQGQILEDDPIINRVPVPDAVSGGGEFDFRREIERLGQLAEEVRARADDPVQKAAWRVAAQQALEADGQDPEDEARLRQALAKERKKWLNRELRRVGMERAQFWGWPNTYTFTKHLGEEIIASAAADGLRACIVRPAIVESALEFPFPGWNEGFTTSGPFVLMALAGLPHLPYAQDLILDIIPVDMVAGVIIAAAAATLAGPHKLVYQACTGDTNPLYMKLGIELVGVQTGKDNRRKKKKGLKAWWLRHNEMRALPRDTYYARSLPFYHEVAAKVVELVDAAGPDRFGWMRGPAGALRDTAADVAKNTKRITSVLDIFMPFIAEQKYIFRADNTRQLMQRIPEDERPGLHYKPEAFVWREYFLDVHVRGLEQWVFPKLKRELTEKPKEEPVYRDLAELFLTVTHRHRHRVALRYVRRGGDEHLTYGELRQLAHRVAGFLAAGGVQQGDNVVLVSENRPEWVAAYFGILLCGATAVPVDAMAKGNEILNIATAANAKGLLISQRTGRRLVYEGNNPQDLAASGAALWLLDEAVRCRTELREAREPAKLASIIFTSGTTGKPKGVMLSHKNFTFEVSRLLGIFKLQPSDHLLSVLPLHHTFEFSAGLLTPLARGACITYLSELSPKALDRSLKAGVTSMIGVPALWQLLQRRIEGEVAELGALPEMVLKGTMALNGFLREYFDVNVGPLAAYPVHRALGGRLKYLVSGGSALGGDVMDFFRGLGFNLTEGYGLTETAPVLTVTDPREKVRAGSVGRPLPGVEIAIRDANGDGIGEVVARGPNVMLGYFGDESATAAVLDHEGWLHTGDLGRLDDDGRLFLAGRCKDVIVDLDGRNVYPDEIEEAYAGSLLKELCIVGLPRDDARAERVAALVVPYYGDASGSAEREAVREAVLRHLRRVSDSLPFYRRVKVAQLWDGELPRTSSRKVKRPEVVAILQRLLQDMEKLEEAAAVSADDAPLALVQRVVHALTGKPKAQIKATTQLGELGMDSLMLVELASTLEQHVDGGVSSEQLASLESVGDLLALLGRRAAPRRAKGKSPIAGRGRQTRKKDPSADGDDRQTPLRIPGMVARAGKQLLALGQKRFYDVVMDVKVTGQGYIPRHRGFLVAANHVSHLDAGLAKMALGEYGRNLVTLAAKDYFFGSRLRRAYFENFTNVLPIERHGAVKQDLRRAIGKLAGGHSLLLFPEGTRSVDGEMQSFKPSLGYLAMTARVPLVPMYLWGTYEAMPKGSTLIPGSRTIGAVLGPAIEVEVLEALTAGMPRGEAYRVATDLVERAVQALRRDGRYTVSRLLAEARAALPAAGSRRALGEAADTAAGAATPAAVEGLQEAAPAPVAAQGNGAAGNGGNGGGNGGRNGRNGGRNGRNGGRNGRNGGRKRGAELPGEGAGEGASEGAGQGDELAAQAAARQGGPVSPRRPEPSA